MWTFRVAVIAYRLGQINIRDLIGIFYGQCLRYLRYWRILPPLDLRGLKVGDKVKIAVDDLDYGYDYGHITNILPQDKHNDFMIQVTFTEKRELLPFISYLSPEDVKPFIEYFVPCELEVIQEDDNKG